MGPGIFPKPMAQRLSFPKSNESKLNIENYRPMSLISLLKKLIENIINK